MREAQRAGSHPQPAARQASPRGVFPNCAWSQRAEATSFRFIQSATFKTKIAAAQAARGAAEGGPGLRLIVPPQAAHHGGMWRRAATPDRRNMPDNQGRPTPRRPGAIPAPRPARRTTPTQERHPRAKQPAGARRVRAPHKSTKFLVLCASVRPGSQNANFVDLVSGARAAARRNPSPGGSGAAAPASGELRQVISGGVLRHPPMGALCFVPRENHQKKFRHGGRHGEILRYVQKKLQKLAFWWSYPPPHFDEKRAKKPLTEWRDDGSLYQEVVVWPKVRK